MKQPLLWTLGALQLGFLIPALAEPGQAPSFTPPPPPREVIEAQKATPVPALPPPDPAQLQAQYEALEAFLQLPPERLRKMRETLERLERMSPEERERLHQRIIELRTARESIFGDLKRYQSLLPEADREPFAANWFRLDPAERQKFRDLEKTLAPAAFREHLISSAKRTGL